MLDSNRESGPNRSIIVVLTICCWKETRNSMRANRIDGSTATNEGDRIGLGQKSPSKLHQRAAPIEPSSQVIPRQGKSLCGAMEPQFDTYDVKSVLLGH